MRCQTSFLLFDIQIQQNPVGTKTTSLTLRHGCDGQGDIVAQDDNEIDSGENPEEVDVSGQDDESGEDSQQILENFAVAMEKESGCASQDKTDIRKGEAVIGFLENGIEYRGYFSFNVISYEETLKWAKIHIDQPQINGSLAPLGDPRVSVLDYGSSDLDSRVVGMQCERIASFSGYSGGHIIIENEKLLNQLRSCLDAGKTRFQIRLYWSINPENNTEDRYITTTSRNVKFYTRFQVNQ